MKSVSFHPEAEAEFIAAARYYEQQAGNLGFDFVSAVENTYRRFVEYPAVADQRDDSSSSELRAS